MEGALVREFDFIEPCKLSIRSEFPSRQRTLSGIVLVRAGIPVRGADNGELRVGSPERGADERKLNTADRIPEDQIPGRRCRFVGWHPDFCRLRLKLENRRSANLRWFAVLRE